MNAMEKLLATLEKRLPAASAELIGRVVPRASGRSKQSG